MNRNADLDDAAMQADDARLPELAARAGRTAYQRALQESGKVIEAFNGQLVETSADGTRRVIRALRPQVPVQRGLTLVRRSR